MAHNKKDLELLDKILEVLYEKPNTAIEIAELIKSLNLDKDTYQINGVILNTFSINKEDFNNYPKLLLAIDFLQKNNYIYETNKGYSISYFGVMKVNKNNTFVKEQNQKLWGTPRERILLILFILSFLANIYSILSPK